VSTVAPGTTKTVGIAVVTATAAADGQSVGDIAVIVPELLANSLQNSAAAAVHACSALSAKLRKRDGQFSRRDADAGMCLSGVFLPSVFSPCIIS
jgi:hypothetical protein